MYLNYSVQFSEHKMCKSNNKQNSIGVMFLNGWALDQNLTSEPIGDFLEPLLQKQIERTRPMISAILTQLHN